MNILNYFLSFVGILILFLVSLSLGVAILLMPAASSSLSHLEFCQLLESQITVENCSKLNKTTALKEAFPLSSTKKKPFIH